MPSLFSSLRKRWRQFIGRLSPSHAILFQLLLLSLVAANILGVVITIRRLQHSYKFPVSILGARRVPSPPEFTVAVQSWPSWFSGNMTLHCYSDFWDGESSPPCPGVQFTPEEKTGAFMTLFEGTENDGTPWGDSSSSSSFSSGRNNNNNDARQLPPSTSQPLPRNQWNMYLPSSPRSVQGDMVWVRLLGLPLEAVSTREKYDALPSPVSDTSFYFDFVAPLTNDSLTDETPIDTVATLVFSAVESPEGRVTYTIRVGSTKQEWLSTGLSVSTLLLQIEDVSGGIPVAWESQEYSYTPADALASVFAYANMSVAIVGFLFPWRFLRRAQKKEGREFKFACDKHSDDEDDDDHADLERNVALQGNLQERMLSRAVLPSQL